MLPAALLSGCARHLGPVTLVADLSWPHGENQVAEVQDRSGTSWIAKIVRRPESYARELYALRNWVPALGGAAPELVAAYDDLRLLIVTKIVGQPAEQSDAEHDPAVHHAAGRLIRRLHDAEPPRCDGELAGATARKLEMWIGRGRELLTANEIAVARQQVAPLATAGPVHVVPVHMDNQPRNWIVGADGLVSLIDFGACKRDTWIRDMTRLYVQQWDRRPDLREAYYEGYGRNPGPADMMLLRCYLAYSGLSTVVWAHEHGDTSFAAHGHAILARLQSGEAGDLG
jgi:Ser/Thr protein kinase RdoA (MazF antagonist)